MMVNKTKIPEMGRSTSDRSVVSLFKSFITSRNKLGLQSDRDYTRQLRENQRLINAIEAVNLSIGTAAHQNDGLRTKLIDLENKHSQLIMERVALEKEINKHTIK